MCPPLVEIGLTDLPKKMGGGARAPPAPPLATGLLCILLYQLLCRILLHPTEGGIVCNMGAVLLHAVGQPYK